jgi:hypothetical protein
VVSYCQFGKNGTRYVNNTKNDCTVLVTEKFYGMGVSPGISTGADIPAVTTYPDALAWLGQIIAAPTYAAIESKISSPRGFLISKRTEQLKMADVLETRNPAA